jgi:3',5'-cyclic-nucleotide phosphodiesterase
MIPLGCTGGPIESNLSGYLLIDREKEEGILLDAGSCFHGLEVAYNKESLSYYKLNDPNLNPVSFFFLHYIKAYLISHAHLDHILGLVIASPIDTKKPILALSDTIKYLKKHIFNGKIWIDATNKYEFIKLKIGRKTEIPHSRMNVEAYLLNHSQTISSAAFLIECRDDYVLYFGDTSSDILEKKKPNAIIWQRIAPLIPQNKLKALFLECSYSELKDNKELYGHLNPTLFFEELTILSKLANHSLEGVKIIVTHRKDNLKKGDEKEEIARELSEKLLQSPHLKCELIFPKQGDNYFF